MSTADAPSARQLNNELSGCSLIPEIQANIADIQALRRDLHAHPELCYQEQRTAALVASKLDEWGIPLYCGLGKTGVVGMIKAGNSTRAIGLRADMDALPMQEQNRFDHASRHPGKMHGCGHDGHTAMLLAAARYLVAHRDFDGAVYLIFQPAEEGGGGADAMIKDGLFEQFPMQAVYGLHNWPGFQAGQFAVSPGPVLASSSSFRIIVKGKGCHAAMPQLGLDPVPVAAQLVMAFQTILTRSADPLETGLLSVTMLQAGETFNVIADSCELAGTVRTFSMELLDLIEQRMREITRHICLAHQMESEFEFIRSYPATVNHPQHAELCRRVMAGIVGADQVLAHPQTMGSEDFAFMLQAIPGCYGIIGNGGGDHRSPGHGTGPCTLHNPSYDFNDQILSLGATYWIRLVETCLAKDAA